jgi:hypothetical protein
VTAANVRRAAKAVRSVPNEWARSAVKDLQQSIKPSLSRDTGGDSVLSGMGGAMKVTSKVTGSSYVHGEVVAGGNRGAWFIVQEGARNRPQGGSSPAKHTWSRAVEPVLLGLMDDAERRFSRAIGSR